MQLGIDRLISDNSLQNPLQGKRIALVAHPASVTSKMQHSIDALMACKKLNVVAAFGPQHGMRGDKQDNMVESSDYVDPIHNIPVFSLYGNVRRPTDEMMQTFDVLLFDIQDLGCRIYTYVTTLLYLLEACASHRKSLIILDRPNPAGRPVEGTLLQDGWQSFVGAGKILMRHGLTLGEIGKWFVVNHDIDVDLQIVQMESYNPRAAPGYGWPISELSWVNPSPNASSLNMARCYSGTVLIEGTHLSEGRGTSIPMEVVGAPDIDITTILNKMQALAANWMAGVILRSCHFEPTFHKHSGSMCQGFQIHTGNPGYDHESFKPFRLIILFLKALRLSHPAYTIWNNHPYEYETGRLPIDVINGGPNIREWIDDAEAKIGDIEPRLLNDEQQWTDTIHDYLLY